MAPNDGAERRVSRRDSLFDEGNWLAHESAKARQVAGRAVVQRLPLFPSIGIKGELGPVRRIVCERDQRRDQS